MYPDMVTLFPRLGRFKRAAFARRNNAPKAIATRFVHTSVPRVWRRALARATKLGMSLSTSIGNESLAAGKKRSFSCSKVSNCSSCARMSASEVHSSLNVAKVELFARAQAVCNISTTLAAADARCAQGRDCWTARLAYLSSSTCS